MKYILIFGSFFLLAFAATVAFACSYIIQPETKYSLVPVTIKIGNTFFDIPEKYIENGSPPRETGSIALIIPSGAQWCRVNLTTQSDHQQPMYSGADLLIEDVIFTSSAGCDDKDNVKNVLLKFALAEEPKNWESDLKLWEILKEPSVDSVGSCGMLEEYSKRSIAKYFLQTFENWISKKFNYNQVNLMAGLEHRNVVMRKRVLQILRQKKSVTLEIENALLKIASEDVDIDLRIEAISLLENFSSIDAPLINSLRKLTDNENMNVRAAAISALSKIDRGFIDFITAKINSTDDDLSRSISAGLNTASERENPKIMPLAYEDLNLNVKKAIKGRLTVLFRTKDDYARYNVITGLKRYGKIVSSDEYIAYLNQMVFDNDLQIAKLGVEGLADMSLKPENLPFAISHFKEVTNPKYTNYLGEAPRDTSGQKALAAKILDTLENPLSNAEDHSDADQKLRELEAFMPNNKNYLIKVN